MLSQVLGSGPVGFTDSSGKQQSIPLSLLEFDAGKIPIEKLPLAPADKAILDALLKNLVAGGFLVPAPTPPPKLALVLEAAVSGAKGNTIKVTFSNSEPPTDTTFDAEITAIQTYSGLSFNSASPMFIEKVLGTTTTAGTSPGLVRIKPPDPYVPASRPKEIAIAKPLNGGDDSAKSSLAVDGEPPGTAFTLEAWRNGADGKNIHVVISDVNVDTETFTLVVKWNEPKLTGITLADLESKLEGSHFVIEVSAPEGGTFAIPASGTLLLNGGTDATAALPAKATAFSR